MRILLVLGLPLLVAAFLAGAAEVAAVAKLQEGRLFLPAQDTWAALWPDSLAAFRQRLEATSPLLWDPLAATLLRLPGWLLLGLPGMALAWLGRPHRHPDDEGPDEDSLFLYDELVRRAREDGFDNNHDDPLDHGVDLEAGDADPELDSRHDDLAPRDHEHLGEVDDELDLDHREDDRAPGDLDDYQPPAPEDGDWEPDAAEAGPAATEDADRPRRPAKPIPDPPALGGGHWVPPPPDPDSGRDRED